MRIKTCEKCGDACQFLESPSNPKASEWYCAKCHLSWLASDASGVVGIDFSEEGNPN